MAVCRLFIPAFVEGTGMTKYDLRDPGELVVCSNCQLREENSRPFKVCGGCKLKRYCSVECQVCWWWLYVY